LEEAHRLFAAVTTANLPHVVNVVPAWRTVVIGLDDEPRAVVEFVQQLDLERFDMPAPTCHRLKVTYDGPDLGEVADRTGLSVADTIGRHAASEYTVAFLGFAPGFPYLAGMDPALAVPRRASARQQVPAGSVGIADAVTGIYPASLPGGWQIIGHVDECLFDVRRNPPTLFSPGDVVEFHPA
jgi:KipI family sensor histidine kinase inhibitor